MSSKDDRKQAADIIKNAMMSRSDSDDKNSDMSEEDRILLRMKQLDKTIRSSPFPGRRSQRKIARLVTEGNRKTRNSVTSYVKDIYTTAEEARRTFINVSLRNPTREVGPGDRFNAQPSYPGKETKSRNSTQAP